MSKQRHGDPRDPGAESAVEGAWQQSSDESPPPELDAVIIAAARRSVQHHGSGAQAGRASKRPRNWLMQWQSLAAAATVAGLAFVLLQVMPRERDVAPSIRMEESLPGPAATRPTATEPRANERAEVSPAAKGDAVADSAATEQKKIGQLADSTSADVPALAAGAAADKTPASPSDSVRVNQAAPEPARAAEATAASKASAEATVNSAGWAARIVALYDSGDAAGAANVLREFRAVEPDADGYLPDALRDWAKTVQ